MDSQLHAEQIPTRMVSHAEALALFLGAQRSPATRRAYSADVRDFFGGEPQPQQVAVFLALPPPDLMLRLLTYKAAMAGRGASPATVNRRLAVIRSLLRFTFEMGLSTSDGRGLVSGEPLPPPNAPPDLPPRLLSRLMARPGGESLRGLRDTALLRLLCENGLSRVELCALNVANFSADDRRLTVAGLAHPRRAFAPLSRPAIDAIDAYLTAAGHRREPEAPLFRNLDHRPDVAGARLTPDGLSFLVREYGRGIGLQCLTPRQLRQAVLAASRRRVAETPAGAWAATPPRREPMQASTREAPSFVAEAAPAGWTP